MFGELARGWKAYLLLAVVVAGLIGVYMLKQMGDQIEGTETTATIVSFGGGGASQIYRPGETRITVESDGGVIGAAVVPAAMLEGCEVGDRIPALAKGVNIEPRPEPCD